MEYATLGGGCFWCLDAVFVELKGIKSINSGYAGGSVDNPSYQQVCSGRTGHAEVVQIEYDENLISYEDILDIFFFIHDPTTLNRQGNDVGTQYRSIILYHNENQKMIAEKKISELTNEKVYRNKIVTEIVPLESFYKAENYHQNYFAMNPKQPYCSYVIEPKVSKFRKHYLDKLKK